MSNQDNKTHSDPSPLPPKKAKPKKAFCFKRMCFHFALWPSVLTLIVALLVGFFVWRISYAPLDVTFVKPYLEDALADAEAGRKVRFGRLALHWSREDDLLLLRADDARVYNREKQPVLSIEQTGIGLSKRYLLLGKARPKFLLLSRPSLTLVRDVDGTLDMGFSAPSNRGQNAISPPPAIASEKTAILDHLLGAVASRYSDHRDTGTLSALRQLRITNARILFDDKMLGQQFYLSDVDADFAAQQDGMNLSLDARLEGLEQGEAHPRINFDAFLSNQTRQANIQGHVSDFPIKQFSSLYPALEPFVKNAGGIGIGFSGIFDENLIPQDLSLALNAKGGVVAFDDQFDAPLAYKDFVLNAGYQHAPGEQDYRVKISDATVTLNDVVLRFSADATTDLNDGRAKIRVDLPHVEHAQLMTLWPQMLEGENIDLWVRKRLSDGAFHDSFADLDLAFKRNSGTGEDGGFAIDVNEVIAQFSFDGMGIDYRAPLAMARDASGVGRFDYKAETLEIDIARARIGGMDVKDSTLRFSNIMTSGAGQADIAVNLGGQAPDILSYLSADPIAFKPAFETAKTQGQADLSVSLKFPTSSNTKFEDVVLDVSGTARDVFIPGLVRGLDVTGQAVDLTLSENTFKASGAGELDGRAMKFAYETFLYTQGKPYHSKVTASLLVDEALRKDFGVDIGDYLGGAAYADITYTELNNTQSRAEIVADITSARFMLDPLFYRKEIGVAGQVSLQVDLSDGQLQTLSKLNAQAEGFSVRDGVMSFAPSGDLRTITVPSLSVGQTQGQGRVDFQNDGSLKIDFNATHFDARPFLSNGASEQSDDAPSAQGPAVRISLSANTMRLNGKEELISGAKLYLDIDKNASFNRLEMDGTAGGGAVYLRYKPDEQTGQKNFHFEADNAGATLAALGLYQNIRGGKIKIFAEPLRWINDRNLIGRAEITDFKVVKAPGLARLLSLMSLSGIGDALSGEGIGFSRLESRFDWLYHPRGSTLVLEEGRTSGNAVGLTFDGTVDQRADIIDISGTVVPASGLNSALGSIPVVGSILTGGGNSGVFAATYKIKGKTENPEVSLNPLSVLAPGILRRLLFE